MLVAPRSPLTPHTAHPYPSDACIIHGSTNSAIDGVTNGVAFQQWLAGGKQWWVQQCGGSDSAGPCDPSPVCCPV